MTWPSCNYYFNTANEKPISTDLKKNLQKRLKFVKPTECLDTANLVQGIEKSVIIKNRSCSRSIRDKIQNNNPKTEWQLSVQESLINFYNLIGWLNKPSVRSSRPDMFCKKGVLRNFTKFARKHLCQNHFLAKLQSWDLQLY